MRAVRSLSVVAACCLVGPGTAFGQTLDLDQLIMTGPATESTVRETGATVSVVDVEGLAQGLAFTGLQDVLSGRVPGLRFTRSSGDVGTGSPMTLRGVSSFDLARNQPIVFIDGIRIDADVSAGPSVSSGPAASVLDDLDPDEIERIQVLKGPAATSLYGTDASAGVIHVVTKRGREGAPELSVAIRRGVNYVSDPAGRLGTQWTCPNDNSPGPVECQSGDDLLPYNMYDEATRYVGSGYFPWPTDRLFQSGGAERYSVTVRGGAGTARYFVATSYEDEEGAVWYNTDERFRLRANVDVGLGSMFSLDVSTAFVDGRTRFLTPVEGDGGLWQDLAWSNGFYLDRVTAFSEPAGNARLGGFQEHLPSDVGEIEATRDYARFTGSVGLRFVSPGFTLGPFSGRLASRALVGIDKGWDVNRSVFPLEDRVVPGHLREYASSWSPVYIPETVAGQMTYSRPISTRVSADYSVTASLEASSGWGFDTTVGAHYHLGRRELFENSGRGFASVLSTTINQIAQADITTTYQFVEDETVGYYVREDVSWRNRVFLSGAVRLDDSSSFGVLAPIRSYPSLSGAWIVSEEDFWGLDAVEVLRLRGAWGRAGRLPTARSNQPTFVESPGLGGTPVIRPAAGGNPAIGAELGSELDVGLDVALLDGRFGASFSRYWRQDEGLILDVPLPGTTGDPGSVERNVGGIDSWGWEAMLTGRLYESRAVALHLDLAFDHTDNEIMELGPVEATPEVALGLPYPNQVTDDLVVSAQFDPDGSEENAFGRAISALCDEGVSLAPDAGSPDADQYGRVTGGPLRPCQDIPNRNLHVGRAFATHTVRVAPRIDLLDGRLGIFALAEGQYGRWSQANPTEWGHIYNNSRISRLEDDPLWVYGDRVGDDTKRELYDADFWKLRELGVRYALPDSWSGRIGASHVSVSFSARNLWTIWRAQSEIYGHRITDPELGTPTLSGNGNFWEAPPISRVSLTLRATF